MVELLTISATDVTTGYGNFMISNVTVDLVNGDIFGLIGRSGSGKSTIINTLVGLLKPKSGTLTCIAGEKERTFKDIVGYSPQRNALYPFLTVEENLRTFGKLYGMTNYDIDERSRILLKRLDLESCRGKRVTHLSGGMEKRVDLAVAMINNPPIIVLDEPFNGLDVSLQKFIWDLLRELAKEGRIIIITSHLLEDIQRNCTKFGLVENNHFYGTDYLVTQIKKQKGSLQQFLEQLFRNDMLAEQAAAAKAVMQKEAKAESLKPKKRFVAVVKK